MSLTPPQPPFNERLDVLPLYAGFLWPLWDAKRQTFSDRMCRTEV